MGNGHWSQKEFESYASSKGYETDKTTGAITHRTDSYGRKTTHFDVTDMYKSSRLDAYLNPYKVTRECVDSKEHPNTLPVILALDVTGSMGDTAMEVAKKLNVIIKEAFQTNRGVDVEFMCMGIGDIECDKYPVQATQFESDIRIAEQLDKIYFEGGGGGNDYESYTAAWYFGTKHTKLDCWKRGKKGVIITLGDEPLNPKLKVAGTRTNMNDVFGDNVQNDIKTETLYKDAIGKFDLYHINVDHHNTNIYPFFKFDNVCKQWVATLGKDNVFNAKVDEIHDIIVKIIAETVKKYV